ncbi:M20 metallopeptidase family protein [uncultured Turicimonas sp.]|uniref:M20 metallopeptidase family protein n=1 Tax=uncultured Turicimonas sp. TaxID=1918607 RepID=UPI002803BC26|nr:amidohydrolase [uncultured Turicimonas sp.]
MTILIKPEQMAESAKIGMDIRHKIHEEPELGLCLHKTQEKITKALASFSLNEVYEYVGGKDVTGVVAVIHGTKPGKTIGLRADSDALPLEEKTGAPWASQVKGKMHACGHDGHVATLLTLCHYAAQHRDFAGTLIAIFQPGEEGFAGAKHMIADGLVERFGIDEFYALHAEPSLNLGDVGFIPGYATANADKFEITFKGKGGHGSRPHMTKDPLVAACECVLALQTIVARSVDPMKTAVVSAGCIQSGFGDGPSVVPQEAKISGTARSFEPEVQETIIRRMKQVAEGTALANDMEAEVQYTKLYPAMFNTPELVEKASGYAKELLGEEHVKQWHRTCGGEDFSFMLLARPGCLFRLGMKDEKHSASVHHPMFDFNDKAISVGAATLLTIALNRAAS